MVDKFILSITVLWWIISLGVVFICTLSHGHRAARFWFSFLNATAVTLLLVSEFALAAPGLEFLAERPVRPLIYRLLESAAFGVLLVWLLRRYIRVSG